MADLRKAARGRECQVCHGTVCVVGKIRDLILQLSKSSIYSTKPGIVPVTHFDGG